MYTDTRGDGPDEPVPLCQRRSKIRNANVQMCSKYQTLLELMCRAHLRSRELTRNILRLVAASDIVSHCVEPVHEFPTAHRLRFKQRQSLESLKSCIHDVLEISHEAIELLRREQSAATSRCPCLQFLPPFGDFRL
jgi:hypothetical protein